LSLSEPASWLKEHVELASAVLGVSTSLFAVVRPAITAAYNRTLRKQRKQASEEVEKCLALLRSLDEAKEPVLKAQNLGTYKSELLDNLNGALAKLEFARGQAAEKKARRLVPREGWAKWLILYPPLNVDGLLAQSCFLGLVAVFLVLGVRWIYRFSVPGDFVGAAFAVFVIGGYLSSAAARIHRVSVLEVKLKSAVPDGLSFFERNLLLFSQRGGDAFYDRVFFYGAGVFLLIVTVLLAIVAPELKPNDLLKVGGPVLAGMIILRVTRASALASRKLEVMKIALDVDQVSLSAEKN